MKINKTSNAITECSAEKHTDTTFSRSPHGTVSGLECSRRAKHRARRRCRRRVYNKRRCSAARRWRATAPAAVTVVAATVPAPAHFVNHPAVLTGPDWSKAETWAALEAASSST